MITEDSLARTIHQVFDREEPSPGFADRIIAALPVVRGRRGSARSLVRFAAAAAAIVLVAALVAIPLSFRGATSTPSGTPASASPSASATASPTPSETQQPMPPLTSVTWTQVDSGAFVGEDVQRGTAWSGGFILSGLHSIWRSADGSAWEHVPDPAGIFSGAQISDMASRGSTLVAVGRIPQTASTPATGLIWTSNDGINWQRVVDPGQVIGQAGQLSSVAAGPAGFVANSADTILYSADGQDWERDATLGGFVTGDRISSIAATPEGFAAVGSHARPGGASGMNGGIPGAAAAWWSTDGRTWNVSDVGSGGSLGKAQPWVGGLRSVGLRGCLGCIGTTVEWRSADAGRTWRQLPSPSWPPAIFQSSFLTGSRGVGLFQVSSADGGTRTLASWTSDGETWQPLAMLGAALPGQCQLLIATDRLLIAAGVTVQGNQTRTVVFLGVLY